MDIVSIKDMPPHDKDQILTNSESLNSAKKFVSVYHAAKLASIEAAEQDSKKVDWVFEAYQQVSYLLSTEPKYLPAVYLQRDLESGVVPPTIDENSK